MSYCRRNGVDSDVYVVRTGRRLACLGCSLVDFSGSVVRESAEEMRAHLLAHRSRGHLVPDRAIERLEREMESE